jgi:hypothetical protein
MMDGAQALSVYVIGRNGDTTLPAAYASRLGKVSVGQSCIRIKRLEHIDIDVLGELVRAAVDDRPATT